MRLPHRPAVLATVVLTVLALGGTAAASPPSAAASTPPGFVETTTSNPVTAAPPVSLPPTAHCSVTLADSFPSNAADGSPQQFSGTLTPPAACPGPWSKVVLTETISVSGRQYDRIGTLTIGGAEVYHGTTEEPSGPTPITYTFRKDLTAFTALLRSPKPFSGGIGNYVSDVYTGNYLQTVTLTYYGTDRAHPAPRTPDAVVPIGDRGLSTSMPTVDTPISGLPRNITGGYLDVTLEGSGCDEQWFSAVPDEVAARYPAAGLCGHGPYRAANVALDGHPVAAVTTFPHIYSGGIVPTLWRPVPAIDTFDLHSEQVDVTPFAGLLVDGGTHHVAIGIQDIGDGWTATANLFLFTDHHRALTSGALTTDTVAATTPVTTAVSDVAAGTRAVVTAARSDVTRGYVDTSAGRVWTTVARTSAYRNVDTVTDGGLTQSLTQTDRGAQTVTSTVGGDVTVHRHAYSYPLHVGYSAAQYVDDQNFSLTGAVDMTMTLVDTVGSGASAQTVRASTENVDSTGVLARTNGVTSTSDGASTSSYVGTDDRGRPYRHVITTEHGVVTSDRVAGRKRG